MSGVAPVSFSLSILTKEGIAPSLHLTRSRSLVMLLLDRIQSIFSTTIFAGAKDLRITLWRHCCPRYYTSLHIVLWHQKLKCSNSTQRPIGALTFNIGWVDRSMWLMVINPNFMQIEDILEIYLSEIGSIAEIFMRIFICWKNFGCEKFWEILFRGWVRRISKNLYPK